MIEYVAGEHGIRENDGRSIGHLAFIGSFEYFIHHGEIYRAPIANPLDIQGIRQGARFECMAAQWATLARLIVR